MTLQEIQAKWKIDCVIPSGEAITVASLDTPKLHATYSDIYTDEKEHLNDLKGKFKTFELVKWLYYQGKLEEKDLKRFGWEQFDLKILKADIQKVVDADADVVIKNKEIEDQQDKVDYVKSIIQSINQRTFIIKNAIESSRFYAGLN